MNDQMTRSMQSWYKSSSAIYYFTEFSVLHNCQLMSIRLHCFGNSFQIIKPFKFYSFEVFRKYKSRYIYVDYCSSYSFRMESLRSYFIIPSKIPMGVLVQLSLKFYGKLTPVWWSYVEKLQHHGTVQVQRI